ncbi:hypothetical protein [Rhizobium leguminosarum]|uniref:Uncharacterized protein n=1 Tax=Rhizobium leguminosarum TaxID=384 RepID=A0A2K9ZF12_RHILE|nr:hypothetical protein [Rhizobium leguminosarum]AUW46829.1 hypothetical protein CUJ84_pRLN2000287 [Rhizobium leguminosarum]
MLKHSHAGEVMREKSKLRVSPFSGLYWSTAIPLKAESAHRNLLTAIEGRIGTELFTAIAYDRTSGAPCACFDIAVDAASGDACGIYRILIVEAGVEETFDIATPAIWCQCEKPEDMVGKVYKHLTDMGFFEDLYWHVENSIPRQVH